MSKLKYYCREQSEIAVSKIEVIIAVSKLKLL